MSMNNIFHLNVRELKELFASNALSPVDVAKAYLENVNKYAYLNNFITVCEQEYILQQAEISQQRYANGTARALEGIPLAVKDLFCTNNIKTTAGSNMLENFVPTYESFITQCTQKAGCVVIGKTNMDEFAMGSSNLYSAFGPTINPWHEDTNNACVSGGSSGGSAGAVAAYQTVFSLGSDTGGSIRQPAAFCGIVGIKPTYGACSRRGMIAFSSSFDQAGPLARDVYSAGALLKEMMQYDYLDATCQKTKTLDLENITSDVKGMKIGLIYYEDIIKDESIKKNFYHIAKQLEEAGAIVEPINIPLFDEALAVYYVLTPCDAASNLARYDGVRYGKKGAGSTYYEQCMSAREHFGEEVKRRILIGTYFSSSDMYQKYYTPAQNVRKLLKAEFMKCFQKFDMLLSPTTPHTAFPIDAKKTPIEMYYEDYFTCPVNISGTCAISVPAGLSAMGMPIGVHVIAPPFREDILIKAGLKIEEIVKFKSLAIDNIIDKKFVK